MKGLAAILIAGLIWTAGLMAFASRIEHSTPPPEPKPAEAIVVLTGKAGVRIKAAAKLLEQGKGERLLVSGVNPQATREDIFDITRSTRRLYDCCVQLGFRAPDTKGNALETAAWVRHENIKSLIVVTSDYHIPRAMLEIRGALPGVPLTAYPVKTDEVEAERWWSSGGNARRMIIEYCKYLAVLARESFLSLGPRKAVKPAPEIAPAPAPEPEGAASLK